MILTTPLAEPTTITLTNSRPEFGSVAVFISTVGKLVLVSVKKLVGI
jgi:hypothetical protein